MNSATDTICARATAWGIGAIAVLRVSGPEALSLVSNCFSKPLTNVDSHTVHFGLLKAVDGSNIDEVLVTVFHHGKSFTGEESAEISCHGSPYVQQQILDTLQSLGCRMANPGEFTKRAFLNGKMDLIQAEAVQDLIQSNSEESALSAVRSLTGEFSTKINELLSELISLRVFVEATIDFSDEEIDFLESHEVSSKLYALKKSLKDILNTATQGAILRDGIYVAIAGKPNAGKSSLLNSLTKQSSAIVTEIAGTTRDVLKETIHVDGMPVHIIDTAGLHNSDDVIEQEGIRRANMEIKNADIILLVYDSNDSEFDLTILPDSVKDKPKILVRNKIDLVGLKTSVQKVNNVLDITISAKNGEGVDSLQDALSEFAGLNATAEGVFLARKRHINAIEETLVFISNAIDQLKHGSSELVAEYLRQAGLQLSQITGEFSSDDLLGEIFSSFCIGK